MRVVSKGWLQIFALILCAYVIVCVFDNFCIRLFCGTLDANLCWRVGCYRAIPVQDKLLMLLTASCKKKWKKSFDSSGSFSLRGSFSSCLSRQLINSPGFFQITSPSRARAGSIVDSNMTVGDVLGQPEYHEYIYIDTDILNQLLSIL